MGVAQPNVAVCSPIGYQLFPNPSGLHLNPTGNPSMNPPMMNTGIPGHMVQGSKVAPPGGVNPVLGANTGVLHDQGFFMQQKVAVSIGVF